MSVSAVAPSIRMDDLPRRKKKKNIYFSLHKQVELLESPISGKGLFAKGLIYEGEVIWKDPRYVDSSHCVHTDVIYSWPIERQEFFFGYGYQIDDNVWTGPRDIRETQEDASVFHNHSCDPNTWFVTDYCLTARRDIHPGEELTFDYSTCSTTLLDFQCNCGSSECRGNVTGNDYKLKSVQLKYGNHFISYINKKIQQMKEKETELGLPGSDFVF